MSKARVEELRIILHKANHDYHVVNRSLMPDSVFDHLFRELVDLERQHPELADPNSPTTRIGATSIDSFAKVKHRQPMLSLDNAFTSQEIEAFFLRQNMDGHEVIVEPKIDGLSMSLTYDHGRLVKAVTRGDGTTGDDVTVNVRTIQSVPLVLTSQWSGEVRGEVYMPKAKFIDLNQQLESDGEELFANPRNAAAGSLKRKDPSEVSKRGLAFIAYAASSGFPDTGTHQTLLEVLNSLGFTIPNFTPAMLIAGVFTSIIESFANIRVNLPYEIDGLVIKVNDRALQVELGSGTRSPNWAVAYKYPPEVKRTVVTDIVVQVGRLGTLTPVAELQPVLISGSTVKRATLHNNDEVCRLGVNVGDTVNIQKAAEIIPQVVSVAHKGSSGTWTFPDKCPCCQTPVQVVVNADGREGTSRICPNLNCLDQVFARLEHAVKKASLDLDGCGEQTIHALMDHGVRQLSDLFTIQDVNFLGDAGSKRFIKGREAVKKAPLWRKLHAFGIDLVGTTKCKELASKWSSITTLADAAESGEVVPVIGPVAAKNLLDFFHKNVDEIARLIQVGVEFSEERTDGVLTGKVFCITGGLMSGTREAVSTRIESMGGTIKSSVSKKVTHLVVGEGVGHNKTEAARKLGTTCVTEEELYQMMGIPMPLVTVDIFEDY